MKVLIVYYSTYGNVYKMARLVAEGVKDIPGAEPVIRTVQELIPQAIIDARDEMKAGKAMQQGIPLVTLDDFRQAGAIAFGTPTRFGNVSAQLKNQIDQLTSLWLTGELEGKPAGIFVSTASLHGGQETTSLTLMAPLLHLDLLGIQPNDRVLEVGFGPGVGIQLLVRSVSGGYIAGVDPSEEMVQQAKARNVKAIESGRVDLRYGSVESLSFEDNTFDKALAINSMQVCPDAGAGLREMGRTLKPGGRIALGFTPYSGQSKSGLPEMLTAAAFTEAQVAEIELGF